MAAAAAMQREAVGLAVVTVLAWLLLAAARVLRLPAGDERRQPSDVAAILVALVPLIALVPRGVLASLAALLRLARLLI